MKLSASTLNASRANTSSVYGGFICTCKARRALSPTRAGCPWVHSFPAGAFYPKSAACALGVD
jgi:hypothetical protein